MPLFACPRVRRRARLRNAALRGAAGTLADAGARLQEEERGKGFGAVTEKGRTYALFVIVVLGTAFGSLSQTAVSAMLGGIQAEFGVGTSVGQWLTTAYMLVLGVTVPLVTFLSRRMSTKALVLLALGLFGAGSLLDCIAWDFASLMAGRVLQAVSAGITMPLVQTIAMTRFPASQHATFMGIAGIALGFAPNIGPVLGGALVDTAGWRSFFVLLIALTAVLVAASVLLVRREDRSSGDASLDVPSVLLSTFGFGGLLLAFSNAANFPPASPLVWVPLALGAVCVALFVVRQRRVESPLVSMRIFASARFRASFAVQNCLFASYLGITLIVPLYIQGLCGSTAFEAGLVFVPATVFALVFNPLAGILSDKVGVRPVVVGAGLFLAAGSVGMAFMDASTPLALVMALQTVRGIGVSSLIGPLASWGLSELPRDIMMDGSAFFATVRQVCASLGTAAMVLVITLAGATAAPAALGYQLAFGLSALLAVATLAGSLWKIRP